MVVSGPPSGLDNLCNAVECDLLGLPDGSQQLSANATSQADVDRLVDLIRQNELSLHKLERTSLTLEEVFLSAVNSERNGDQALGFSDETTENLDHLVESKQEENSE